MTALQTTGLNIISLNIEADRHLDRIVPFVQKLQPDVILLQEALDKDIPSLEKAFKMNSVFTALSILCRDNKDACQLGILTLSHLPLSKNFSAFYRGDPTKLEHLNEGHPEKMARAILVTEYIKDDQSYCLVNTHFTWSPKGQPSAHQHHDLNVLLNYLSDIPEFILCGDFNAPRGTAIFDTLALHYKDNIPLEVSTTIDKNWHKAGDLNLMVDGLFTTPNYNVNSVEIVDNLSDHCAIVATVEKIGCPIINSQ